MEKRILDAGCAFAAIFLIVISTYPVAILIENNTPIKTLLLNNKEYFLLLATALLLLGIYTELTTRPRR
jgi:hypothetical protein